jgi:hypothetical protein
MALPQKFKQMKHSALVRHRRFIKRTMTRARALRRFEAAVRRGRDRLDQCDLRPGPMGHLKAAASGGNDLPPDSEDATVLDTPGLVGSASTEEPTQGVEVPGEESGGDELPEQWFAAGDNNDEDDDDDEEGVDWPLFSPADSVLTPRR